MNLRAMIALGILALVTASVHGQTLTTGQISGTVTDPSGAVVPKAQVTVSNTNTGIKRSTECNADGYYVVPLLDPGNYVVTITAKGFETVSREGITVAVSRSALVDFRLQIGGEEIKVTVSTAPPLLEPSNPNTTSSFNSSQLANLPNPGNDLSYVANFTPGVVGNIAFANSATSGNFEFNGLGSVTNDFTIDGLDANDPFFNLNLRGASGLQLGLNAVQEVSVNTVAYSVAGGRLGSAEISYVTKSGTNTFHGNAYELWNGSALNAKNFFLNALGKPKPFSNVNQFGASVGGPIWKDKLFFFTDLEGVRLVLPVLLNSTLPTPAYQAYVLQQLPLGGTDSVLGTNLPPEPGEVPLYQNMFKLMGDTSRGTPLAALGCPFNGDGTPAGGSPPNGNGCANSRLFSSSPKTNETLWTFKLDYNLNNKNSLWFRFQLNNGSSPFVDAVNPIFNIVGSKPIRSGTAGWTHMFTQNLVNQFNPGLSYSSGIFDFADRVKALAAVPFSYSVPPFSTIGNFVSTVPTGQAATTWQLNDNLTWSKGKHELRFGENLRRVLVTDVLGPGAPFESGCSLPEFTFGATCSTSQTFFQEKEDRIKAVNLDLYAMDTFKVTRKFTLTLGLRGAWNSDLVSGNRLFSRFNPSFAAIPHDVNRPLNADILANQSQVYGSTPLVQWQPRAAIAYEVTRNTLFRAGFGVFGHPLLVGVSSNYYQNLPSTSTFQGGLFGSVGGIAIAPGVPNSAVDAAIAANQRVQAGFSSGALSCVSPMATAGSCLPRVNFIDLPPDAGGTNQYPYAIQWSSGVEREFGSNFRVSVNYVGTGGRQLSYRFAPNSFQKLCSGCFAPIPFNAAPDPRFGIVTVRTTGANSNYNGLQITAQERASRGLFFQFNYSYSHCLDYSSNFGIEALFNIDSAASSVTFPGQLKRLYSNCDYDIRNSLNGSYFYELPFHSTQGWLNHFVGGWQISGTLSLRGGLPVTVRSSPGGGRFSNGTPGIYPNLVAGQDLYSSANVPGVTLPGTIQFLNPNAFQSVIDKSTNSCFPTNSPANCQDGNLRRNSVRGPDFRWADFSIGKRFKLTERMGFKFDAQFFNVFNHPNFAPPNGGLPFAGIPGKTSTLVGFGTINSTVSPNTGLLGSGLGGDSSVRMIGLRGRIEF